MADPKPSYVREMLTSQGNLYALLGSLAAGVALSLPFGFGIGAIPLIAFAAGELIAALYVPEMGSFRNKVDRKYRRQYRTAMRDQLLREIESRSKRVSVFQHLMRTYTHMSERVAALYARAESGITPLAVDDVERLEDATIEYLCMWLAGLAMDHRQALINPSDIEARIAAVDEELRAPKPGSDVRQLQKARADFVAIVESHHRMQSRQRALEAAMLAMPDQMEEIYQTIMTASGAQEFGARLEEAMTKLRLQEDIEAELAGDLADAVPAIANRMPRPAALQSQTAAAAARPR